MAQKKIAGWREWAIKRDLAEGLKSQRQIATKYGVTQGAISQYLIHHRAEVDELRGKLEDALTELWAADKVMRIAAYQEVADEMAGAGKTEDEDARAYLSTVEARRAHMAALRSIADELGAIPQRVQVEGGTNPVRHILEGVDPEALA